jgi:DNA-binding CsgD family transcriptional regulator
MRRFCEASEAGLHRGDPATLALIDDQFDDIRASLAWAGSDAQRAAAAVAMVGALGFYWLLRGRFREGIEGCRRALAADSGDPADPERIRARWALADAMFYGGDPREAIDSAVELAADSAAAGLTVFQARCLGLVGLGLTYSDPRAGLGVLEQAVALALDAGDDFARIDNQQCRANAHYILGDIRSFTADLDGVRALAERSGNAFHLGWDGAGRACAALLTADPRTAIAAGREGQIVARRAGESNSDAFATNALCCALADAGRPEEALREIAVADESFARRPGQLTEIALAGARAYVLAAIDRDAEALAAARHCTERSFTGGVPAYAGFGLLVSAAVLRRTGDLSGAVPAELDALIAQGCGLFAPETALERARLFRALGEPDRAEETAHAALVTAVEGDFRRVAVLALEELAHLAGAAGTVNEAARLLGACRTARRMTGLVPNGEQRRWIEQTTAAVVARLGDEDTAATLAEGEQLTLDGAIAYARRARGERGRPAAGWGSLTPTERQVVDLVVEGLSNPLIAERLLMSRGTVKAHLAHVFTKLGVSTRAELAAMAVRRS